MVSPKNDGNVGAVTRVMGNFGFDDLCLVNPCGITEEAYKRAKHAGDILRRARTVESVNEAVKACSLVAGTTGIVTESEKHFVRIPLAPREFAERARESEGRIALLFGPEDSGLSQEELGGCDLLVHIPASEEYPVLNLSHAVAILLYEIHVTGSRSFSPSEANEVEKEKLFEFFSDLLDAIGYPEFRREKTEIMFRRMMGRAVPSKWEFYTIMGVLGDAVKRIRASDAGKEEKKNQTP
ncbi:MAG: RNA methyltransferase [Euryarchaeota archaeon]|nr:RNA methyltransferase [Euryarchaeota archaeon]